MQVGAGRKTGIADIADNIALLYPLAYPDPGRKQVRITGVIAVLVPDKYVIAKVRNIFDGNYLPVRRRDNRVAGTVRGNIYPLVNILLSAKGVLVLSKKH